MTSLFDTPETKENIESYHNLLVGPEAKFKTDEDLAKGKYESDNYIKTLERQLDEYRKDLIKEREGNTLRAELQSLKDQLKQPVHAMNAAQQSQSTPAPADKPSFDPNEVKSLVSNTVKEIENSKRKEANFKLVQDKLTERFGNNYQPLLEQQIKALDLTIEEANELATTRPQVFLKTFGLDNPPKQENITSPPRTTLNTTQFKPEVQKRTWSYYQKMKMEDPKRYVSPATNVQMHKDALELGDTFMDGDFNKDNKELTRELGYRAQPPSAIGGYNPFKK